MPFEKLAKGRGAGRMAPDSVYVSWSTHFMVSVGSAVAKKIKWQPGMKVDIYIGTDDVLGEMQVVADPNGQYLARKHSVADVLQVQRSTLPHVTPSKHPPEQVEFKYLEKGIHITDLPAWATPMRSRPAPYKAAPLPAVTTPKKPAPQTFPNEPNRDVIAPRTNTNRAPAEFLETVVSRRCIEPSCRALFRTNLVSQERCSAHSH